MATFSNQIDFTASESSLPELEAELAKIHGARGWDLSISPTLLSKRRGAFHDAAVLQVLITWARLNPSARLKLSSRNQGIPMERLLVESCDYSVGIATLAIAPIILVDGVEIPRSTSLLSAASRMDNAFEGRYEELVKGRCVDLLCVSGAKRQFVKPLFDGPNKDLLKDKFSLKTTVRGLAMKAHPRAAEFLSDSVIKALATFTHELFENTQDHAISDLGLKKYRRHVEGLFVSNVTWTDDSASNDFFSNAPLRDYWATLATIQSTNREGVSGICFSFIDSGPGMAARMSGQEHFSMEIEQEREALLSCLNLRSTTKAESGAGGGLTEVLNELSDLHGLIRIRSGRLSIFKAFSPSAPVQEPHEGFQNWFENRESLAAVAGTLISIFIPLSKV
jgi:hypothetical protein